MRSLNSVGRRRSTAYLVRSQRHPPCQKQHRNHHRKHRNSATHVSSLGRGDPRWITEPMHYPPVRVGLTNRISLFSEIFMQIRRPACDEHLRTPLVRSSRDASGGNGRRSCRANSLWVAGFMARSTHGRTRGSPGGLLPTQFRPCAGCSSAGFGMSGPWRVIVLVATRVLSRYIVIYCQITRADWTEEARCTVGA